MKPLPTASVAGLEPDQVLVAGFYDEGWRFSAAFVVRQFIARGTTRVQLVGVNARTVDLQPGPGERLLARDRTEYVLGLPNEAELETARRLIGTARLEQPAEPEPSEEDTMKNAKKQTKKAAPKATRQAATKKATKRASAPPAATHVTPADGEKFTKTYKGTEYTLVVKHAEGGAIYRTGGQDFSSPSAAAVHVTGKPANGWTFWGIEKVPAKKPAA